MNIYKTINLINGLIYIGQEVKYHDNYLGSGIHISRAIKKYGKENFKKEIIEECKSKEKLNKRERYWIKKLKAQDKNIGYNISDGGAGNSGYVHSEETRQKISESQKHRLKDPNARKILSVARKDVSRPKEIGIKISNSKKDMIFSIEHRKNLSKAAKGKPKSKEHIKNMTLARWGK